MTGHAIRNCIVKAHALVARGARLRSMHRLRAKLHRRLDAWERAKGKPYAIGQTKGTM